jgi:hypothetical protein
MRLDYQRAPGAEACPDADTWRDAVVSKIEGAADPFSEAGPQVLRVSMDRRGVGYRAAFEVVDALGRPMGAQEHTAATCPEAARALALGASLLFVARPAAPPPPPQTTAPPLPPPPAPQPPQTTPARRWRVQVGAGAGAAAGFSPFIAPSFAGFAGLRFPLREGDDAPAFAISIEGRGDLESSGGSVVGPDGQTAQVRAAFAGGTLAPCIHASRWFLGCVLLTVGQVRSTLGPDATPETRGAVFVGLGGRAGLEIPILRGPPAFAVRVALDGWFSLARPEVQIAGEPVWTAPQGAGTLGAYLVTLF